MSGPIHSEIPVEFDGFVVDCQLEPNAEGIAKKRPGTVHYHLDGVEVARYTSADALKRERAGWTVRPEP